MKLNSHQQDMLDGKYSKGHAMAMEILIAIGDSFNAEEMVPIDRAHVALSAQKADTWFAEKMAKAGVTCAVSPTVNPGYSICYFKNKNLLSEEAKDNMLRVESAYKSLGSTLTYSCTPYLFANTAHFNDIASFSETSVTIFANSVIGARTNRESSFSSLCAAITGYTPLYGYLLDENRKADIIVNVEADFKSHFDFAMLGLMAPKIGRGNPIFVGIDKMSTEDHINLGTQLNVAGSYALYHVLGVTPEAKNLEDIVDKNVREVTITDKDLEELKNKNLPEDKIDFVMLGCPHYTYDQILYLLNKIRKDKPKVPIWVLTSKANIGLLESMGLKEEFNSYGVDLVPDTCTDEYLVWNFLKGKKGISDSPKCSYYMSSFGLDISVADIDTIIELAR
ncbi:MAG: aconitase X catalytic domain-containing protein [Peptoniphilus sp.]|nr:aconitase X catalytic domain-containing protein [Peptoniphilus sp.]